MPIKKKPELAEIANPIAITTKKSTEYSKILQGCGTNAVLQVDKKRMTVNNMSDTGKMTTTSGVEVTLSNINTVNLNPVTQRVYMIATRKLTQNFPHGKTATAEQIRDLRAITLDVKEYMDICGISDRTTAREQLKNGIISLYNTSLEWKEKRRYLNRPKGEKQAEINHRYRILDEIATEAGESPIKRGVAKIVFSYGLAEYLSQSGIINMPDNLYKINIKQHPYALSLGYKLFTHYGLNIRNPKNDHPGRIKISNLLKAIPGIPTFEEVRKSSSRSVERRIIEPIENDLDEFKRQKIILNYKYCDTKGKKIPIEQADNFSSNWENWYLEFEPANYPDMKEIQAKTQKRQIKARRSQPQKKKINKVNKKENT